MFKPVITTKGKKIYSTQPCWRCDGSGIFQWAGGLYGVNSGTCFRCGGSGVDPQLVRIDAAAESDKAKAKAYREKAKAKKAAEKAAKEAAAIAANETGALVLAYQKRPETVVAMISSESGILADMLDKLLVYGELSAKQWAFADRLAAERKVTPVPAPVGRQTVQGRVVKLKSVESQFGVTTKMIVKANGFMVYGTVPQSLWDVNFGLGDLVEFTATFEQSKDDQTFGFFKRPSKAVVLAFKKDEDRELQEQADKEKVIYFVAGKTGAPISDPVDTIEEAEKELAMLGGGKIVTTTMFDFKAGGELEAAIQERNEMYL
jgi:hypothetical protein